jgi:hypothetical protein
MQVLRLRPGYWPSISLKLCFEMQTFPRRSVIATACADRSQNIFAPTDSRNKAAVEAHPNLAQNARLGWGTRLLYSRPAEIHLAFSGEARVKRRGLSRPLL